MAKDFLGNTIKKGDTVVYMQVSYRCLRRGVVSRVSPKKVSIRSPGYPYTTYQFHNQVLVIDEEVQDA